MQNSTCAKNAQVQITQFELSKQLIQSRFFNRIKLTASARLVLVVLCSHYPNIYPSVKTIQDEAGIASKQSVISALKELSKHGLILIELKRSNNYSFTGLFFEIIGSKNCTQIKKDNKKNNKSFLNNFSKSDSRERKINYCHNTQINGIKIPKFIPDKKIKESPLDLNKEQAIQFINNLPERLQKTSFFANKLREKWNL